MTLGNQADEKTFSSILDPARGIRALNTADVDL